MRNKLLLLALFILTMASHFVGANAQSQYGILYNGQNVQNEMSIAADPSQTFNFAASLPGLTYSSLSWTAEGGVEIVGSPNGSSVSVRSKSGTTNAEEYSRYAKGRLRLVAEVDTTIIPPGCESCEWGQWSKAFGYEVLIYKTFDWSGNSIVGPSCVNPGDSVTYSVAPWVSLHDAKVVGFDDYYWDIPDSLVDSELYYSADQSSETFVVSENIAGMTISARIGKYNCLEGVTQQAPLTLTLDNEVPVPILSGMVDNSYCLPFGTDSVTFTVSNASPEVDYNWDLRTWRILSQNGNGSSITFKPENNEQTIMLNITGGCSEKTYLYDVNRSLREDYVITNDYKTPNCLPANTTREFFIKQVPQGTAMQWNVSGEGWSVSQDESKRATPQISVGTGMGVVTAYCSKCLSVAISDTFYIAPDQLGEITGEACLDPGDTTQITYSVSAVNNVDRYEWSYPSQWGVSGSADGNIITLIPDGVHVDTVKVRAVGCNETDWSKLAVKMAYAAPQGISIAADCINIGEVSFIDFSVDEDESVANSIEYEWSIPSTFGSIWYSLNTTKQRISVRCRGNEGNHVISVQPKNSCGSSAVCSRTISLESNFELDTYIRRGYRHLETTEVSVEGATYYEWYVNGIKLEEGSEVSEAQFTLSNEDVGGYYYKGQGWLIVTYQNGCKTKKTISWDDTNTLKSIAVASVDSISAPVNKSIEMSSVDLSEVRLYPNPANNIVNIALPTDCEDCIVVISDLSGRVWHMKKSVNRLEQIDTAGYPRGSYIVSVKNGEHVSSHKLTVR